MERTERNPVGTEGLYGGAGPFVRDTIPDTAGAGHDELCGIWQGAGLWQGAAVRERGARYGVKEKGLDLSEGVPLIYV